MPFGLRLQCSSTSPFVHFAFFRSLIRKHGLGLSLTTACAREPFGREEGDGSAPIRRALSHDCVEHLTIEELRAGIACDRSTKDFVPRSRFICANITLMMRICVVLDKRSISVNKQSRVGRSPLRCGSQLCWVCAVSGTGLESPAPLDSISFYIPFPLIDEEPKNCPRHTKTQSPESLR